MKKQRRNYSAQEKVAILKRHLVEKVPISELCEQLGLQPNVFCRRQKEFFENGAAAFRRAFRRPAGHLDKQILQLAQTLRQGQRTQRLDPPRALVGAVGKAGGPRLSSRASARRLPPGDRALGFARVDEGGGGGSDPATGA